MSELEELEAKEQTIFDRIVNLETENQSLAATRKEFMEIASNATGSQSEITSSQANYRGKNRNLHNKGMSERVKKPGSKSVMRA